MFVGLFEINHYFCSSFRCHKWHSNKTPLSVLIKAGLNFLGFVSKQFKVSITPQLSTTTELVAVLLSFVFPQKKKCRQENVLNTKLEVLIMNVTSSWDYITGEGKR